jgi:predicted glycosyltransferase
MQDSGMKIAIYCQHVLGIGHLYRTLEISRALKHHEVILVSGGGNANISLPQHVREERLPGLMMDSNFKNIFTTEPGKTVAQVQKERKDFLWTLFEREAPDIFLLELYPFGRKAFRFELDPILNGIRNGDLPRCRVVCSLRDVLVEKKNVESYENRVVAQLNAYFDALLVHADPELLKLDETFSRMEDIAISVIYTGFVSSAPQSGAGAAIRKHLGIGNNERLLVASAGGGKVGGDLLRSVLEAYAHISQELHLHMFTGPYLDDEAFAALKSLENQRIKVLRFTPEFLSFLDAADLSISMAGYNTCMNILATQVPALVWPFPQNREQRLRALKLADLGWMQVLAEPDLDPVRLAGLIERQLAQPLTTKKSVDLNGAARTAAWLETLKKRMSNND